MKIVKVVAYAAALAGWLPAAGCVLGVFETAGGPTRPPRHGMETECRFWQTSSALRSG
jgi:hypothetical protein